MLEGKTDTIRCTEVSILTSVEYLNRVAVQSIQTAKRKACLHCAAKGAFAVTGLVGPLLCCGGVTWHVRRCLQNPVVLQDVCMCASAYVARSAQCFPPA